MPVPVPAPSSSPSPPQSPSPSAEHLSAGLRVQDKLKRCSCSLSTWVVRNLARCTEPLAVDPRGSVVQGAQNWLPFWPTSSLCSWRNKLPPYIDQKLDNSWADPRWHCQLALIFQALFGFLWRLLWLQLGLLPGTRLESLNYLSGATNETDYLQNTRRLMADGLSSGSSALHSTPLSSA